MTQPRIILATGQIDIPGAIIIDHRRFCFWRDGERRPTGRGRWPIAIFHVVGALLLRAPGAVTTDELIGHVYGEREDGGPLWALNTVKAVIHKQQGLFVWLGGRVSSTPRIGYRFEFMSQPQRLAA